MATPSTSPSHSFVFKLRHSPPVGKQESRRYGFSGDLRHPAVFTGLYDRTAQVFDLDREDFALATTDNIGRHIPLRSHQEFLDLVCEPTLSDENSITLDDKKRIVLIFYVIKKAPAAAEVATTAEQELEAANAWDQETAEALARSQETFNSEQEAREKGLKAFAEVRQREQEAAQAAQEEARRVAQAAVSDSVPLVDFSAPAATAPVVAYATTSDAGPPAPPAVPLSSFRSAYHPYQQPHSHIHHGPGALGGPFHHHHLPPHTHSHAHSHAHGHSTSTSAHEGTTASRLAVMQKRIQTRREMQERLQGQGRATVETPAVVAPAAVSVDGYHPAYSTTSTETSDEARQQPAQESAATPTRAASPVVGHDEPESPIAETWTGVKGMLKTFVRDLNRHLADNFGDDARAFELSIPAVEQEGVRKSGARQLGEEDEKVVHPACFCDRCLKTIVGVRHKCTGCSNYDLCTSCLPQRAIFHNTVHIFARIARPGAMPVIDSPVEVEEVKEAEVMVEEKPAEVVAAVPEIELEVHPATCDACNTTIKGTRHKCLECPDFDLCSQCLSDVGAVLHPQHNFLPLTSPTLVRLRPQPGSHAIHSQIICDVCNVSPIIGVRYRCVELECGEQFDMCERCEADPLSKHPRGHQVLKIREPVKGGERVTRERMSRAREVGGGGEGAGGEGAKGEAIPLASLGGGIERLLKSLGVGAPATAEKATSTEGVPRWATVVEGKGGDRTVVIDVDVSGAQVKHGQAPCDVEALVREAEKEGEEEQQVEVEVAAPVPAFEEEEAAPAEVAEKEVDQTLRASFVADVTLTDGSIVPSGSEFMKTWLVRNSGALAWPQGTMLVNVGGFSNLVAGEGAVQQFEVTSAEPGDAVEIQCELKALEEDGHYMDFWRLKAPSGDFFGDRFWVDIIVESNLRTSSTSLHSSLIAPSMHASGKLQGPSTTGSPVAATTVSSVVDVSVRSESMLGEGSEGGFESVAAAPEEEDVGSSEEESEMESESEEEDSEEEQYVVISDDEEGESSDEEEDEWEA